jgi:hypothetical protein
MTTLMTTDKSQNGFTDSRWGNKARSWVGSAERLNKSQWGKLVDRAFTFILDSEKLGNGTDERDGERVADLCSRIELDWYVIHSLV